MNKNKYIKESFLKLQIELSDIQVEQFIDYFDLLVEKNKLMNLTAITEFEDVVLKHFLDSVLICKAVDMSQFKKGIDVGTGAGFPGIPLKIVFPWLDMVLLDSLNKRISFLDEVICKCNLFHVKTIHGRAEELAQSSEYREKFDICFSRAVANLSTLSELCIPFVKEGGCFVSYKSDTIESEIEMAANAISLVGGNIDKVSEIILPDTEIKRKILFVLKEKKTPGKYPRRVGIPSKKPL